MQNSLSRLLAVVGLVVVCVTPAAAQLEIEITRGMGSRTPVAIVPFGWQGLESSDSVAPFDVSSLIGADLQRSGRFAPVDESKMLQKPTSGIDVDFDDWSILGVEAVVVGSVTQNGANDYDVQFQLFDVFRGEHIFGYRMPASRGTMRKVAHRAADLIYEKLTGIQGVFGTKVTYVTARGQGHDRGMVAGQPSARLCLV